MADNEKQDKQGIVLETGLDKKGREKASATFGTPGSEPDRMYISPNHAIPVIFVPGIMGSPLIATGENRRMWPEQGKWAWFPDSATWVVRGYGKRKSGERKKLLNPQETRPVAQPHEADEKVLADFLKGKSMPIEEARRRGWGSVMLTSYGELLYNLENQLKFIFYRGNPYPGTAQARPHDQAAWGEVKGYRRLADDELRKAAAWRFPVYAVGYNWTDTNSVAANYLKQRIDEIRTDCRERLKLKCDKVILVTHSMGGLVARMCAKRNEVDILGVVHGVQPATGAGTAYARVRGGWESNTSLLHPIESLKSIVGAWALGATGAEVTEVFANCAGPLELLPSREYGSNWLKVDYGKGGTRRTLFSLPARDPYAEIYAVDDKWWRLVHPGLVDPENSSDPAAVRVAWVNYKDQLKKAAAFHAGLGSYYHANTYAHCGADAGKQAWRNVTWALEPLRDIQTGLWAGPPSSEHIRDAARLTGDQMTGHCEIRNPITAGDVMYNRNGVGVTAAYGGDAYRAWLSSQDDAGDATVPGHSGLAPRPHVPFFAAMRGFEHQGSYADEAVRAVTLYSILSIAAGAAPL